MKRVIGFGRALLAMRLSKGLNQRSFDNASSRTYVSAIERGTKIPTLGRVEIFAEVLGVHPLTLLTASYMPDDSPDHLRNLLLLVEEELCTAYRTGSFKVPKRK